jgi:signal transduction histidine kinase
MTALLGALGARRLTRRLQRLTDSAMAVGNSSASHIEVPPGRDEVSKLAAAFAKILEDLQRERSELRSLGSELERRVALRTREVERLAEESRYAAIMRERLKIARDLHDTLAHSMMAMLSEVRLLRRMQAREPSVLADELMRAEQIAQDGLNEARTAITQMRVNVVRDTGLGAALERLFGRFIDHTGITGEFTADPAAANVGDERAETIYRIADEALRNIERHAQATRVTMSLRSVDGTHLEFAVEDNGIGFDPQAIAAGHFGIMGLREQAQLIGAVLELRSAYNSGTTLRLRLRIVPEALSPLASHD